jgi:ADP-ribosylglycohydrolase
MPVKNFIRWRKLVGGRYWGYIDEIAPGEYSDDTQLMLAVARSISDAGKFQPDRFAYEELPLWLHYERGGGRSIKAAARSLIGKKVTWLNNFYRRDGLAYWLTGANGAAMRELPIALANPFNSTQLVEDSVLNAIVTHGHPRAILGAVMYGLSVQAALTANDGDRATHILDYVQENMGKTTKLFNENPKLKEWQVRYERHSRTPFSALLEATLAEAREYLATIPSLLGSPIEYYKRVGALEPATKGSGVGTVCVALYLFLRHRNEPHEAIYTAVNTLGSDTDTIATLVGGLFGARYGLAAAPQHLADQVQDRDYLLKVGAFLHSIAAGGPAHARAKPYPCERREAYLRILAWEIGLHEMFWDAIDEGGVVVHPTLGRGRIVEKRQQPLLRHGYTAKLIRVKFDSGQSCVFHSRVKDTGEVSESLSAEVEKALGKSYPSVSRERSRCRPADIRHGKTGYA